MAASASGCGYPCRYLRSVASSRASSRHELHPAGCPGAWDRATGTESYIKLASKRILQCDLTARHRSCLSCWDISASSTLVPYADLGRVLGSSSPGKEIPAGTAIAGWTRTGGHDPAPCDRGKAPRSRRNLPSSKQNWRRASPRQFLLAREPQDLWDHCVPNLGSSREQYCRSQGSTMLAEPTAPRPRCTLEKLVLGGFRQLNESCQAEIVKLNSDPEDVAEVVHDLRVALRRLRNMLKIFAPYMGRRGKQDLAPKKVSELLRVLGPPRDTGAMLDTLTKVENRVFGRVTAEALGGPTAAASGTIQATQEPALTLVGPTATVDMTGAFAAARARLRLAEQRQLKEARQALEKPSSTRLFQALEDWVQDPDLDVFLQPVAGKVTAELFRPALLGPHLSALALHPAWQILDIWPTTEGRPRVHEGAPNGVTHSALSSTNSMRDVGPSYTGEVEPDHKLSEQVHCLRKHLRELRYAMELLAPETEERPPRYAHALAHVKELQGVLGDLQDLQVLAGFWKAQPEQQHQQEQQLHSDKHSGRSARKNLKHHSQRHLDRHSQVAGSCLGAHLKQGEGKKHGVDKGKKGSSKGHQENVVGECATHSRDEVIRQIIIMQLEVWDRWLATRGVIGSDKGWFKLFKSSLLKPDVDGPEGLEQHSLARNRGLDLQPGLGNVPSRPPGWTPRVGSP